MIEKKRQYIKISIITVTLNNKEGFMLTKESIVKQTADRRDWEWIVIDGKSIDGTVDVIRRVESQIAYWVSEPDGSIYEAMNKGIIQAQGEYLLFLNAGDTFCSVSVLSDIISNKTFGTTDYISGNVYYTKNNKIVGKAYSPQSITGRFLFCHSLCHQSTLIRRTRLMMAKGYDTNYRIAADAKFFFQDIILNNASYSKLDCYIVNYDITGISATNWGMTQKERSRFLSKLLSPRIYADYCRLQYGGTSLEKILCKVGENSLFYRLLTCIALFFYLPIWVKHRFCMFLKTFIGI